MDQRSITQLFIYPIKSLGGISKTEIKAEMRGFRHDRRWMLIDQNGRFLSQREFPRMALLRPEITDTELLVRNKTQKEQLLQIPLSEDEYIKSPIEVEVWESRCNAFAVGKRYDEWFSDMLRTSCRLVYLPDQFQRLLKPKYALPNEHVSFADGYPYLILGEASLNDLNQRLETPVPINRFRPNIVFSGAIAYEEDHWKNIKIGHADFRGVKPCARCQITTIDQETAAMGKDPLRTMAQYRRQEKGVIFGLNACWVPGSTAEQSKVIRVGDVVKVEGRL